MLTVCITDSKPRISTHPCRPECLGAAWRTMGKLCSHLKKKMFCFVRGSTWHGECGLPSCVSWQIKMLASCGHQGHLRQSFCVLISTVQLLLHLTITPTWGIWQAQVTLKAKGEKALKTNHKNCFTLSGAVTGWPSATKRCWLLFQGAPWCCHEATDCSPLHPSLLHILSLVLSTGSLM